jgi:2-polyprenyl-3-methyl-5-hydroxy-6-metoxy-1,4-benzoquinol methylase
MDALLNADALIAGTRRSTMDELACDANDPMNNTQSAMGLTESYAGWRSSRLGQVTDTLEQQLLSEMLGSITGKTLLDVGCGDGALASELARRGAIVTGLDPAPAMIAAARRRSETAGTQPRYIEGRAEILPFEDATFDRVVAVALLCFVGDADEPVAEMARVLKPGGRLIIGELGRWSLWAAYRRIRGWMGNPTWRMVTFRTARELRSLVRAAGLDVVQIRGAIYYPPCSLAAQILAPIDLQLGRNSTIGAAFVAVSATKPLLNDTMNRPAEATHAH